MTDDRTFVVVGGGLAGAKSVEALRERGFEGRLVLLAGEAHLPYERPPLSKDYLKTGEKLEDAFVHDEQWYADHDIDLRSRHPVASIDRAAKAVVTEAGERIGYDRLLLATGSAPRRLTLPGADLDGVLTPADDRGQRGHQGHPQAGPSRRPHRWRLDRARGGGGGARGGRRRSPCWSRWTCRSCGCSDRRSPRCSPTCTASATSTCGPGVTVEAIEGDGSPTGVRLGGGEVVPADTVIVGIGAAPIVTLAEQAGLEVDNGILADEVGRTSDSDVFAVGDVAHVHHPFLGHRIRVEHWANALNQPSWVVPAMLDQDGPEPELPYFFTDQYDLGMEYTGLADPERRGRRAGRPGVPRVHRLLDPRRPGHRRDERQRLGRHRADQGPDPLAGAGGPGTAGRPRRRPGDLV